MLVSAISANRCQSVYGLCESSRSGECIGDTTFNSLSPFTRKNSTDKDGNVYDSINEWKSFCHQQIAAGKLDIIA